MKATVLALLVSIGLTSVSLSVHAGDSATSSREQWREYWRGWKAKNAEQWAEVRGECREEAEGDRGAFRSCKRDFRRQIRNEYRIEINPTSVPEIDGAGLPLALGLLAGIFGLVRERRAKATKSLG